MVYTNFEDVQKFVILVVLVLLVLICIIYLICNQTDNLSNINLTKVLLYLFLFTGLIFVYYILTGKSDLEAFSEQIEQEKQNYIKFKETYVPLNKKNKPNLDLLYADYKGTDIAKQDVWENKTLAQCLDSCNKLSNCVGFSRDAVNDNENANCYPKSEIGVFHSTRKGNYEQRQKAIKHNTYIKSNVKNVLNMAIGDVDLTLNRKIFIKSVKFVDSCIGVFHNNVQMIDVNVNYGTLSDCQFIIEPGFDSGSTVSLKHQNTGYYLYRDENNNIVLKSINRDVNTSSIDKQRASFNLLDGITTSSVKFESLKLDGEKTNKYITIDTNNKYLSVKEKYDKSDKSSPDQSFEFIDNVIVTGVIDSSKQLSPQVNNLITPGVVKNDNFNTDLKLNKSNGEKFEDLDTASDNLVFDSLLANNQERTKQNVNNFIEENYIKSYKNTDEMNLQDKYYKMLLDVNSGDNMTRNIEKYNNLKELNQEIEKEIDDYNKKIMKKNDNSMKNLDKMRITDMASDYFFLKSLQNRNA